MLYLKAANWEDMEKEYAFVRDMPLDENGFTNEWHGISREAFTGVALPAMMDWAQGRHLPVGYVPETFYFLWDDDRIIGQFRLRHFLYDSLKEGAGHIGYSVHPSCRGMGYGKKGLRLLMEAAKSIVPEEESFLRVNKDNPASLRVMLQCGGIIHHEDAEKIYVRIKKA